MSSPYQPRRYPARATSASTSTPTSTLSDETRAEIRAEIRAAIRGEMADALRSNDNGNLGTAAGADAAATVGAARQQVKSTRFPGTRDALNSLDEGQDEAEEDEDDGPEKTRRHDKKKNFRCGMA